MKLAFSIFTVIVTSFLFSCTNDPDIDDIRDIIPAKNSDNYQFNADTRIIERLNHSDKMVLDYLKNMDGDESYTYYKLSPEERILLDEYLQLLPGHYIEILKNKLLGIYPFWRSSWYKHVKRWYCSS